MLEQLGCEVLDLVMTNIFTWALVGFASRARNSRLEFLLLVAVTYSDALACHFWSVFFLSVLCMHKKNLCCFSKIAVAYFDGFNHFT